MLYALCIRINVAFAPFSENSKGEYSAGFGQAQDTHMTPLGLFSLAMALTAPGLDQVWPKIFTMHFSDPHPPAGPEEWGSVSFSVIIVKRLFGLLPRDR